MRDNSSILFNEKPLVINTDLAVLIGLNEALILQQIQYWITINKQNNRNYINGRYWVYQTYEDWCRQFPFWSRSTIARTLRALDETGLILKGNFNKMGFDKTVWYSIDYDRLEELRKKGGPGNGTRKEFRAKIGSEDGVGETENAVISDSVKMTPSTVPPPAVSNCDYRECQDETTDSVKMTPWSVSNCDARESQNDTANTRDYTFKTKQENQTTTTATSQEISPVVLADIAENRNNGADAKNALSEQAILGIKQQIEKELGEPIPKKAVRELVTNYGLKAVLRTLRNMKAFRVTNTIRSQTAFFIDAVRGNWTPPILQVSHSTK